LTGIMSVFRLTAAKRRILVLWPVTGPTTRRLAVACAQVKLHAEADDVGSMTADELWELPDNGLWLELVRGELREVTPAGEEHRDVSLNIGCLLQTHVRDNGLGRVLAAGTGFVIQRRPDTVRAPDAAFVSGRRSDAVGQAKRFWPEAPDFAAEVASPDDSSHELEEKALQWLEAGTKAVLVVDPERRIAAIYRRRENVRLYEGDQLIDLDDAVSGWRFALPELFVQPERSAELI
jgi:Uma2 family endonuclease